jgi:ribosomal protein L37E
MISPQKEVKLELKRLKQTYICFRCLYASYHNDRASLSAYCGVTEPAKYGIYLKQKNHL